MAWVGRVAVMCAIAALSAPGAALAVQAESLGSYHKPTYLTSDPEDPDRLMIAQQTGQIILVDHGDRRTMLDLAPSGLLGYGDAHGLFSFAPAPDFGRSGHLYLAYSRSATLAEPDLEFDLQVDRYTVADDSVDLSSRRPLLRIPMGDGLAHSGSQLEFGPDGMLWISIGDGSVAGTHDQFEVAQSINDLRGKLLRIDPLPSGPTPYAIPADNPFAGATPGADEVWSFGLRNPWRFSFDAVTADLWISDVGEQAWEEVNSAPWPGWGRGANYGWDCREGPDEFEPTDCVGPFTEPFFSFPHPPSGYASIIGGYVVRDPSLTGLYGRYLYGELISNDVRSIAVAGTTPPDDRLEIEVDSPVSFGEDACRRLYVVAGEGEVVRLVGDAPADCSAAELAPPPNPQDDPPIAVSTCRGAAASIEGDRGTKGADVLVGGPDAETLVGRGGDDLICGGGGADRLRGGAGADRLLGGSGADRCRGGRGRDRLRSC